MDLLTNLALFAGAGGLELGAQKCGGFRTVGYVERDRYAQGVLMSRIRGGLDDAPIWDDVTTFDGRPYRGLVDVISGGFPCQDVSVAGRQDARESLENGSRSGLWKEFARIIDEIRPNFALVENVPGLLTGGMGEVLGQLSELGFDARWRTLSAAEVGAPHNRNRVWIVAYPRGLGLARQSQAWDVGETTWYSGQWGNFRGSCDSFDKRDWIRNQLVAPGFFDSRKPLVLRVADGMEGIVDRLRLCGNGVVPNQSVPAWALIKQIAQRWNE